MLKNKITIDCLSGLHTLDVAAGIKIKYKYSGTTGSCIRDYIFLNGTVSIFCAMHPRLIFLHRVRPHKWQGLYYRCLLHMSAFIISTTPRNFVLKVTRPTYLTTYICFSSFSIHLLLIHWSSLFRSKKCLRVFSIAIIYAHVQ